MTEENDLREITHIVTGLLAGTKKLLDSQIESLRPHVAGDALIGAFALMETGSDALERALDILRSIPPV